jgi:aspartate 4-decarboxylase
LSSRRVKGSTEAGSPKIVVTPDESARLTRDEERQLEALSPFELKTHLLEMATTARREHRTLLLDAGRGNPNWIATEPREAFFALGTFALTEARRSWDAPGLAGMPQEAGVTDRFLAWAQAEAARPGVAPLVAIVGYGIERGFDSDAWIYELVDGIVGDHYPGPDRMLVHAELVVREYLTAEMCARSVPLVPFDLFAVEGGTAAMCYIFDSLAANRLLEPGDTVALMVPAFTPYLEIPRLDRYAYEIIELYASAHSDDGSPTWQFPDSEIDKLADPTVKALFVVNPSNPPSVMLAPATTARIAQIVATTNPGLIVVTDDVYGTFVQGFRSLMATIPRNIIAVYSFSKYFGATGWRLGVIAVSQDNVFDAALAELSDADKQALDHRYETLALEPRSIRFIDRMVADSRQVALNHTAGLSLPQQVQMTLFSASALIDRDDSYKLATRAIIGRRLRRLYEGMGIALNVDPLRAGYYAEIDLQIWARQRYGNEFADWLADNYEPVDPLFRLARQTCIVLLPGAGFDGPAWSIRVSLANLDDDAYFTVGQELVAIFDEYVGEWRATFVSEQHR